MESENVGAGAPNGDAHLRDLWVNAVRPPKRIEQRDGGYVQRWEQLVNAPANGHDAPSFDEQALFRLFKPRGLEMAVMTERDVTRPLHKQYPPLKDVQAFEVLARIAPGGSPDRYGLIGPKHFESVLESSLDLQRVLFERSLATGCAIGARMGMNGSGPTVAVNLSPDAMSTFSNGELTKFVRETADKAGISPCRVALELLETTTMSDVERRIGQLRTLAKAGIGLRLDDFPKGHTKEILDHFATDRQLPLAAVKLDGSAMRGLAADAEQQATVHQCIKSALSVGAEAIIAEGPATAHDVAMFRTIVERFQKRRIQPLFEGRTSVA